MPSVPISNVVCFDWIKWTKRRAERDMVTVLYEEWEMACCGGFFELGDRLTWTVSKVLPHEQEWTDENPALKKLKPYFLTDYHYESHTPYSPDFLLLEGTVKKITIICITYAINPKNPTFLNAVSGFTWNIKNSCYRDNPYIRARMRANKYFDVDAYRVYLDDPKIWPCTPEDWGLENI